MTSPEARAAGAGRRAGRRASARPLRLRLLLALVLGWTAACSDEGAPPDAVLTGDRPVAPEFAHPDLSGRMVDLAELRGRTVVIDFWATWCPPCAFQPAELNAFWERHRDSGQVAVLGIEVGGASVSEIREWGEENDAVAEYPILTGADEDLARRFGAMGFPALAVVAPDGTVSSLHVGLTTAAEIEALAARAAETVAQEPPAPAPSPAPTEPVEPG